jgi:hypothetical protein
MTWQNTIDLNCFSSNFSVQLKFSLILHSWFFSNGSPEFLEELSEGLVDDGQAAARAAGDDGHDQAGLGRGSGGVECIQSLRYLILALSPALCVLFCIVVF